LDGVRLAGGDQENVAGDQVCLLAVHDEKDFSGCDVTDLLVGVGVGWVWLRLGTVVEVHDDDHQVVGVPQAAFGSWTNCLYGHFGVF
jgi:hypothetical protein